METITAHHVFNVIKQVTLARIPKEIEESFVNAGEGETKGENGMLKPRCFASHLLSVMKSVHEKSRLCDTQIRN